MQNKYSDRDRKSREDKEDEIKLLKKEIEKLNEKIKKSTANYEKEINSLNSDNLKLKQEMINLNDDGGKDNKDKIIKLERAVTELQNNFAVKKVELTQSQAECEKLRQENNMQVRNVENLSKKIDHLEKELVLTKQNLGDALNEISELEKNVNDVPEEKKKKKGFSIFKRK
jgi:chromosome segregation ATPase